MTNNAQPGSNAWQKLRDLTLPQERMIGGVCTALGRATPLAAWMWRVLFLAALVYWGYGAAFYLAMMLAIPDEK